MTVEDFHNRYPPIDFAVEIVRHKDFGTPSKLGSIAEMYRKEGVDGVKKLDRKYAVSGSDLPMPKSALHAMSSEDRHSLGINLAGIFFGISLQAIESALVNRQVDRRDFMTRLVNSLTSTRWNDDMIIPEEPPREIPRETWDKMLAVSRIDKTFGEFFTKEGQEVLPHELQGLMSIRIAEQSMLYAMQEAILPEYLKRVGPIFTKPPKTT